MRKTAPESESEEFQRREGLIHFKVCPCCRQYLLERKSKPLIPLKFRNLLRAEWESFVCWEEKQTIKRWSRLLDKTTQNQICFLSVGSGLTLLNDKEEIVLFFSLRWKDVICKHSLLCITLIYIYADKKRKYYMCQKQKLFWKLKTLPRLLLVGYSVLFIPAFFLRAHLKKIFAWISKIGDRAEWSHFHCSCNIRFISLCFMYLSF